MSAIRIVVLAILAFGAARVVGLFRLTFRNPDVVMDKVKGEPAYLILAMDHDKVLRLKPQNLITGLPIKHLEAVT